MLFWRAQKSQKWPIDRGQKSRSSAACRDPAGHAPPRDRRACAAPAADRPAPFTRAAGRPRAGGGAPERAPPRRPARDLAHDCRHRLRPVARRGLRRVARACLDARGRRAARALPARRRPARVASARRACAVTAPVAPHWHRLAGRSDRPARRGRAGPPVHDWHAARGRPASRRTRPAQRVDLATRSPRPPALWRPGRVRPAPRGDRATRGVGPRRARDDRAGDRDQRRAAGARSRGTPRPRSR